MAEWCILNAHYYKCRTIQRKLLHSVKFRMHKHGLVANP